MTQLSINKAPIMSYQMNCHGDFVMLNDYTADLLGAHHQSELIGKSYYDMNCEARSYADQFMQQDQDVIAENLTQYYLALLHYSHSRPKLLCGQKSPVAEENGNICGIYANFIELPLTTGILNLFPNSKSDTQQFVLKLNKTDFKHRLSNRQHQVLLLLLKGLQTKNIAKRLHLSHRTVEFHINGLKSIFNAKNRSELIQSALDADYHNYIPDDLLASLLIKT